MKIYKCTACITKNPCILIIQDYSDTPTTCPWKEYQKNNNIEEMKADWKEAK